jgi:hypothetical protein
MENEKAKLIKDEKFKKECRKVVKQLKEMREDRTKGERALRRMINNGWHFNI